MIVTVRSIMKLIPFVAAGLLTIAAAAAALSETPKPTTASR